MTATFDRRLTRDLTDLADSMPLPPTPAQVGFVTPGVITHARRVRRRRRAVTGTASVIMALAATGGSAWWTQQGPQTTSGVAGPAGSPTESGEAFPYPPAPAASTSPMTAKQKAEADRANAAFTRWAGTLPEGSAVDSPVLGGRIGAPTLTYRGHTVSLPAEVATLVSWQPTPLGLVAILENGELGDWVVVITEDRSVPKVSVQSAQIDQFTLTFSGDFTRAYYSFTQALPANQQGVVFGEEHFVVLDLRTGKVTDHGAGPGGSYELPVVSWGETGMVYYPVSATAPAPASAWRWRPGEIVTAASAIPYVESAGGQNVALDASGLLVDSSPSPAQNCLTLVSLETLRDRLKLPCAPSTSAYSLGPQSRWAIVNGVPIEVTTGRRGASLIDPTARVERWWWLDADTVVGDLSTRTVHGDEAAHATVRCALQTGRCERLPGPLPIGFTLEDPFALPPAPPPVPGEATPSGGG